MISPADSCCFGDTKELSEDGIGEFSDHDDNDDNDDDCLIVHDNNENNESKSKKRNNNHQATSTIEKYFTITTVSSPSTVFEQSLGMSIPEYICDSQEENHDKVYCSSVTEVTAKKKKSYHTISS
jgi:hypothetical protein